MAKDSGLWTREHRFESGRGYNGKKMKIIRLGERYFFGSGRTTISKARLNLKKIDAFQLVKLTPKLDEPTHVNKAGNVFCMVIDGWMDAFCEDKVYRLKRNEGILFERGERHKILKGNGLMLSISSEDYSKKLKTIYFDKR